MSDHLAPKQQVHDVFARATLWTGFARSELTGPSRQRDLCQVRFAVIWAIRECCRDLSDAAVARIMDRDRSVMIYSRQQAEKLRERDGEYWKLCERLAGRDHSTPPPIWRDRATIPHPACARLIDAIPLRDVAPTPSPHRLDIKGGDPALPELDIASRRRAAIEARLAHERAQIAAEQARYGVTRQTRVRPLSAMVA